MLSRFYVKNFKQFNELSIDFKDVREYGFSADCLTKKGALLKTLLIYGPNASGKSNLGFAIFDIVQHLVDRVTLPAAYAYYLNADHPDTPAEFTYEFTFQKKKIVYRYAKTEARKLVAESLYSNDSLVFSWDQRTGKSDFSKLKRFGFSTLNTSYEFRSISFLRYLANNSILGKTNFVRQLMDFVGAMLWFRRADSGNDFIGLLSTPEDISLYFINNGLVEKFEQFLNEHGVHESLAAVTNPDGRKALYFKHKTLIPLFPTGSSGTIALAVYFYWTHFFDKASFIFIDEFDAFYHCAVAEKIFSNAKTLKKQCILTTHNTNLLDNKMTRPDCCFQIIDGTLCSLANRTEREIRLGNNLEKLYLAGEFDAK